MVLKIVTNNCGIVIEGYKSASIIVNTLKRDDHQNSNQTSIP